MNLNKIIATLKFIFRKRINISDEVASTKIKDIDFFIDSEMINNYTEAVKNQEDKYDEYSKTTNAHPLFYTRISWNIIENLNKYLDKPMNEVILTKIIHQSEYIEFYEELKPNIKLTVKSRIWNIRKHKKGTKLLTRFDYYSEDKLLATEYSEGLLFGIKLTGSDKQIGELPKFYKTGEKSVWETTLKIDKDLPYFYAEKTKINADIHTNPKFAKSIGLPDIILQGTCSLAKSVNTIINNNLKNEEIKIKSISAKFTGMTVTPNEITIKINSKNKEQILFSVFNNKNNAVIQGGEIKLYV